MGKRCGLLPYIIVGHPGEGGKETNETSGFLRKYRLSGTQSQIFTPTPMTRSTAIYYLGYDPLSMKDTGTEKDRKKLEMRKRELMK